MMAGTAYQVRSYGDTIVSRKLMRLADLAGDMRPAWPAVVPVIARGYENSFKHEGPGWAPLKASTERKRISEGYAPGPIRTRSRKDRNRMTNANYLANDTREYPHSLDIWGTDVSEQHQYGTKHMPARPLKLTRWYQDQIARTIERELLEAYDRG
jgi:hypothetical protein